MVFMTPFILSIVFMGLCLLNFLRRREDAIMLIMYTSLPAMMLTGFSWPSVAMPLGIASYQLKEIIDNTIAEFEKNKLKTL